MDIEYLGLSDIKPYEKNPRKNDQAVDAVASSIREFGFKNPIIVDKDNVIIAGHTRLKAAEKLGLSEVPVIRAEDLTEEQVKAFRLADNKVSELADWDLALLDEELAKITGVDMEQFGFEGDALETLKAQDEEGNPVSALPESRVLVCSVSAFGTSSEVFLEIPIPDKDAERLLKTIEAKTPEEISEKIVEALNDLGCD